MGQSSSGDSKFDLRSTQDEVVSSFAWSSWSPDPLCRPGGEIMTPMAMASRMPKMTMTTMTASLMWTTKMMTVTASSMKTRISTEMVRPTQRMTTTTVTVSWTATRTMMATVSKNEDPDDDG